MRSRVRRPRRLVAGFAAMAAALTLSVVTTTPAQAGAAPGTMQCLGYRTVDRSFHDWRAYEQNRVFTVQFTNLHVCFNGEHVWFTDDPQFRVYIAGQFSSWTQGACSGVSRTPTDPTNTARRSSIHITCNAVFSNKSWGTFYPRADVDINGGSTFVIPGSLNAGLNLGGLGFVAGPTAADQMRYYTLRIYPHGTYEVSGVGNPGHAPL